MPNYHAAWSGAKAALMKRALTGHDVPPEFVMTLSQGRDLGPALKKFDAAKSYEERIKCVPAVLRAKDEYTKEISKSVKASSAKGKKALADLQTELGKIWLAVEKEAQPPRPSGQMVKSYSLRKFDLAAGLKPEFLKVDPILIDVEVEIDKHFKELLDGGRVAYRAQLLGDAAMAELEKVRDAFKETILKVDATIKKDPAILEKKTEEANKVLQYYRRLVEDRLNLAVRAEWERYLKNKQHLKDFQVKTGIKVVLGTIGVGVAVASVALSFGTAWMNIIAAVKGFTEVAKAIKTAGEGIDTTYKKLLSDLAHVDALNKQREAAKAKGEGQKASKAKQVGKEVLAGLLPITKDMIKATSAIDARCNQFFGQIGTMDESGNQISERLVIITKNLTGLPDRMLSTAQINLERRMDKAIKRLAEELADITRKVKAAEAFGKRAQTAVQALKREDSWTAGITADLAGLGTKGAAISALTNFVYETANAGKSLIAL